MTTSAFDRLTRRAGGQQDRRLALKALGAVVLAGAAGAPGMASAKKKGKGKGKGRKKRAQKLCQRQVAPCRAALAEVCEGDAECEAVRLPCCDDLGRCDAEAFFACVSQPVFIDPLV